MGYTICPSISRSVGQKMCFLDWPVNDFEVSDDEPMISTVNPWCCRRLTDFVLKIKFLKNHRGQTARNTKRDPKIGLWQKFSDPNFQGRRQPWGILPLLVAVFQLSSGFFFFDIFLGSFVKFLAWFPCKKLDEKPCRSEGKVSDFLGKPKPLLCVGGDLSLEAKTRSNDVGMI